MDSSGNGADQVNVMYLLDQQRKVIEQQEQLIQHQKKCIESQFSILQQHQHQLKHKQSVEDYKLKTPLLHSSNNQEIRPQQNHQKYISEIPTQSIQRKHFENVESYNHHLNDGSPVVDNASDTLPDNNIFDPTANKDNIDNIHFLQHQSSPPSLICTEKENSLKSSNTTTSSTITHISSNKRKLDEGSIDEILVDLTPSIFDVGLFQASDYDLSIEDKHDKQIQQAKEISSLPVNKSKTKRRVIIKNIKDPYLNFGLDEEFLVAELYEVKQQIGNEATSYYLENNFDQYMEDIDCFLEIGNSSTLSWGYYMKGYDERRNVTMKIVSKFGNSLIPRKFGKFPEKFLVNVLEHSYDTCIQIEHALFASLDPDYTDLYTQNMNSNIEWSCANKEFMEKNLSHLKDYPPVKFEDLGVFKSPWCSSYEDEQFFMETTKELGMELRRYPRIVGIATMMSMIIQPESSPFSKSKNLQRFFKELASLMNRYLVAVNENSSEASKDCDRIIGLIMKLPRCSDIFLHKRLDYD